MDIRLTDNNDSVDLEFSNPDDPSQSFGFRANKKYFLTWIEVAAEWIGRDEPRRFGNATDFILAAEIIPVSSVPFDDDEDNGNTDDLIRRAMEDGGLI